MIEFTDMTIREAEGDFKKIDQLMREENFDQPWMLRSEAQITTPFIAAKYILHFWDTSKAVIWETDRPMRMDVSDDDLRELQNWCKVNGWKELHVDNRLLEDRVALEYWNRCYIAGLVHNDVLKKNEDDEMKRLMKAQHIEESDDAS